MATIGSVVFALAGCQADPESDTSLESTDSASECTPGGSEVESISIEGEFGSAPEVTLEAPLEVESTQRAVVIPGEGETVANGDDLMVDYALYNAATGVLIEESGYSEVSPTVLSINTENPNFVGLSLTLSCSTVGSRIAGLIPPLEAFGLTGAPEFGLEAGEALLFIGDIIEIKPPPLPALDRLEGDASEAPDGFPTVTYAEDGTPTVELPEGDIPTEFDVATVIAGEGVEVGGGDIVVVQYHGVNWSTGEVFDSSWERGEPASFPTSGVITGFSDGLVGQNVGSRVIIIIPPELGYGPAGGTPDGSIGATDTIVFVVDILGLQ